MRNAGSKGEESRYADEVTLEQTRDGSFLVKRCVVIDVGRSQTELC